MTQLNQIIAIEQGERVRAQRKFTDAHHLTTKAPLLAGQARTYSPIDDAGERLPDETQHVQVKIENVVREVAHTLTRLFDVMLTKDLANTRATADVVIEGDTEPLLREVPVTYLLWVEHQLDDIRTFVTKLPVLDPGARWSWDPTTDTFASEPIETVRTRKVYRNHVLAPATDKHPAQVQPYTEDEIVGRWTTRRFSGAISAERKTVLLNRVDSLYNAVKVAREKANSMEIIDQHAGRVVFDYLFG